MVFFWDNLGWGEVRCYGGGVLRGAPTPRIDRLASEGVRLLNFNIEAQCNAIATIPAGAGMRKCGRPRKATLCDDRHIVLQRFADKPALIILGKLPAARKWRRSCGERSKSQSPLRR